MDCVGSSSSEMGNHIDLINKTLDACNLKNSMKLSAENASYSNGPAQKMNDSDDEDNAVMPFSKFNDHDGQENEDNGTLACRQLSHSTRPFCKALKDKDKNIVINHNSSFELTVGTTENECNYMLLSNSTANHVEKDLGNNKDDSRRMTNLIHTKKEFQETTSHVNGTTASLTKTKLLPSEYKNYSQSRPEACNNVKTDEDIQIIPIHDSLAEINDSCNSKNAAESNGSRHEVINKASLSSNKVNLEMEVDKNKGNALKIKHNSSSTLQKFSSKQSLMSKTNRNKPSTSKICNELITSEDTTSSSNHSVCKNYIKNMDTATSIQKRKHKERSPDLSRRSKSSDPAAKEIFKDNKGSAIGVKKKPKEFLNQNMVLKSNVLGNSNQLEVKCNHSTYSEKSVQKNLTSSFSTGLDGKVNKFKKSATTVLNNVINNERRDSISSSCSEHKKLKQSITLEKKKSDLCITLKLSSIKKRQRKKDVINNIIHEVLSTGSGPIKVNNSNSKQTTTRNEELSVNHEKTHTSISKSEHTTRISNTMKVSQTRKLDKNRCTPLRDGEGHHNNNCEDQNVHTKATQKALKSSVSPKSTKFYSSKKRYQNGELHNSLQSSEKKHKNSEDCVTPSKSNYSQNKVQEKLLQSVKEKMRESADVKQMSTSALKKKVSSHVSSSAHAPEIKSKVCKKVSVVSVESDLTSDGTENLEKIDKHTDKYVSKSVARKSKQPLNTDQLSHSGSKHNDKPNETYSSLRVSEIRNTEDKISLTLSRCVSSPHQNKHVKSDVANIVPKAVSSSTVHQLHKSASKRQEQSNQICHTTQTSEVRVNDNKKTDVPLGSNGDSSKSVLQTSVSLETKTKLSASQECSTLKHGICSLQTMEIENKACKSVCMTISDSDKSITTTTIQSKSNFDSVQKKSKKISYSEHLDSKRHTDMSGPCNASQALNGEKQNKDCVYLSCLDDDNNICETRPSISTVKKKLTFSTTAEQVHNSEHQNHPSKISSSQVSEVGTKISKKVCNTSSISSSSSSCPKKTLNTSVLNQVQKIMKHAKTSVQKSTHDTSTSSENLEIIFVPLNPNDLNSVNNLKQKLNLVTNTSKLCKQNRLANLLSQKDRNCVRRYSTHRDKLKAVEKHRETNSDSSNCHNAEPKVIVEKLYENSCDTRLQFNPSPNKPNVVVEKNPYLCLGLTEVSALKLSDDDEDEIFNMDSTSASSVIEQGIVERRKRFRSLSSETSRKQSKVQHGQDKQGKISIASLEKSVKLKQHSAFNIRTAGMGTRLSDIPCVAVEIEDSPEEFLQNLHGILFNEQESGSKAIGRIKKNILNFNGFSFTIDSVKYQIIRKRLKRLHFQLLSEIEDVFFGSCLVNRSDAPEKVLNFLMHPTREEAEALRRTRVRRMRRASEEHKELKRQLLEKSDTDVFPKVCLKRLKSEEIESYLYPDANNLISQNQMSNASVVPGKKITTESAEISHVSSFRKRNGIRQSGRPLKSFPDVASDINNADQQTVSLIHVLLFGSDGDSAMRKEHILEFSGFSTNRKCDLKNRKKFLRIIPIDDLKKVCKVLHLKLCSQDKESMINGLLQFIKFPCEVFLKKPTTKDGSFKCLKRKSSSSSSNPFVKRSTSKISTTKQLPFGNVSSPETSSDASFSPFPTLALSSESNTSMGFCGSTTFQRFQFVLSPVFKTASVYANSLQVHKSSVFNNSTGELMPNESPIICASKAPAASNLPEVEAPVGKTLESFETIRFNIECATPDDLSELYDVLFVKSCDSYEIHQRILQFRGFEFNEESMEFHFRKTLISYMNIESVEKIAKFLNLIDEYTHMHKSELADYILKFLVGLKTAKTVTSPNSSNKRTHIVRLGEKVDNSSPSLPVNESQVALQPFKFRSGTTLSPPLSMSTLSTESYPLSRRMNADVSSSSEDEIESSMPLISFANHPSDSRLKKDIKEILYIKGFNITMKELIASTYAKYPEFDLRYRSNFIKSKARHILSNLPRS